MLMIKKALIALIVVILGFGAFLPLAEAKDYHLNVYYFWGNGCPHCAKQKPYMEEFKKKYPEVRFYDYEIYYNKKNVGLLQEAAQALGVSNIGVPFTIIADTPFVGFTEGMVPQMEERIKEALANSHTDSVAGIVGAKSAVPKESKPVESDEGDAVKTGAKIALPLLGELNLEKMSLPMLTVTLGVLDGFNPCAMWVLLFLISLLLNMENRFRMWVLGSAFIVASGLVYFIFMAAWLNLILFLGMVFALRVVIGLVAIGGGYYNLREYFKNPHGVCKVTGAEKKQKIFSRLKDITHTSSFWLALGGIVVLAFMVNLVEMLCSAGLPAVFTQILALNNLSTIQYYLYILLYIFFFMLDDLIVFAIAMTTLRLTGLTTKYTRYAHLIGGVLMVIIGILMIFRPGWLMFG
jgi:thiol-disulfide isomerase/thioredoxin